MITLHSLDQSRALRIVWLLELIGAPYQIKTYARHPETLLAPDELKAVHPLGKSPVIDDDGFVLNESGAITDYLIQTYGNGRLMPERGSREYWQYQRWLHYAEGSLMPLLLLGLVFRRIESAPMPFFVKPIARKISGSVKSSFIHPQATLHLSHIDSELENREWLVGNSLRTIVCRIECSKYHEVIPREVTRLSLHTNIHAVMTIIVQVESCQGST